MKAYFYCRVAHDDSFYLEQQAAKLRACICAKGSWKHFGNVYL